jgi:hypothetical protein
VAQGKATKADTHGHVDDALIGHQLENRVLHCRQQDNQLDGDELVLDLRRGGAGQLAAAVRAHNNQHCAHAVHAAPTWNFSPILS